MPVTAHPAPPDRLSASDVERWRSIPVAGAVDLGRTVGQIDPAIRPLRPPGQQPRLFGRAVTAWCEPPDFGAVPVAVDQIGVGDVLVIAAAGHAETAMIGAILGAQMRRGAVGLSCDGAARDAGMLARSDALQETFGLTATREELVTAQITPQTQSKRRPERRGDMS